eukprot:CAMPEP_0181426148 /NCGR_PEP_ID=MMETSP1110-20121109/15516_1 /TAXON_ID=174948 /ORGANISM="Symbiodinium sp., Strain CCMP421" /LENGTH=319 /DNA_ID=CAMNT_0023549339 /DNA_START=55 /DNA_END=1014 /DNA_ORIENTATION=-
MAEVRQTAGGASTLCLGLTEKESTQATAEASASRSMLPPGGKSTICLGMDSVQQVPKRETLAPPGGKSTICLGMETAAAAPPSSNAFACGAHQNSGNVLTERPTTMLSAPPGGKATLCLGMYTDTEHFEAKQAKDGETETSSRPPAGKSTVLRSSTTETDNLSTRPVGGKDHIVLGAETLELQDSGNRVTAGGNSSICFGTDTSEWRVSSKALGQPVEASAPTSESEEKDAPVPAQEMDPLESLEAPVSEDQPDLEALAPTPVRVPPGGLASVVLGTASEGKREDPDAKLEVKHLKQDLPTPARSIRAPPGGAATVLLG